MSDIENTIGWGQGSVNNTIGWGQAQEAWCPVSPEPTGAPVGATLMKTGQTTSYRTGDDGDIEAGRATSFTVLASNNPFGNTNRFTDELGGQTYTNNIVIDWSTYNGSNVLGWDKRFNGGGDILVSKTWNVAIDEAKNHTNATYLSGWRLPNRLEIMSIVNDDVITNSFNYNPFNNASTLSLWTSTTSASLTNNAFIYSPVTRNLTSTGKTVSSQLRWMACRTFTVTGTTLT